MVKPWNIQEQHFLSGSPEQALIGHNRGANGQNEPNPVGGSERGLAKAPGCTSTGKYGKRGKWLAEVGNYTPSPQGQCIRETSIVNREKVVLAHVVLSDKGALKAH